jgi:single-stranded-DNA-specific exonuclease
MAPKATYRLSDPVPHDREGLLGAGGGDPLAAQLLWNRGLRTAEDIETFLRPDYDAHLHDPFLMTDMDRAVPRILDAVAAGERIAVYSDYDCDGIPGGVVLFDFFTAIGHANVENYIPHRHDEGFGFNTAAAEKLAEGGATLILTVDCGTADVDAIAHARMRGVDVIVTDHHEPGPVLPDAFALLNPKRDDAYPFRELCGAGVAYKLVQALVRAGRERGMFDLADGWEKWLLDMVGIATVADRVPLVGENRALAHYGLVVLRKSRRPGLQQLFRKSRASQRHVSEDDIGFLIGPRINAASRMDTPEDAFALLATTDEAEAGARLAHLERLNNERKGVVAAMSKELKKRLERLPEIPAVIVMGSPSWRPALVGLCGNTLAETYGRPVFLWGRDGRGAIKGSCRSGNGESVVELMNAARGAFVEFGGHHGSGGFSVADDKIHALPDALVDAHRKLFSASERNADEIMIDADLALADISDSTLRVLRALAPFGDGNPKPLFRFRGILPVKVERFGKAREHTKLVFDAGGRMLEAVAFYKAPEDFLRTPNAGETLTLIAHIEESFFMNRLQTRLRIVDSV